MSKAAMIGLSTLFGVGVLGAIAGATGKDEVIEDKIYDWQERRGQKQGQKERILWVNSTALHMLGMTESEFKNEDWMNCIVDKEE